MHTKGDCTPYAIITLSQHLSHGFQRCLGNEYSYKSTLSIGITYNTGVLAL